MTPTQPGDGAVNITVDSTDLMTDGQRNIQQRITAFIGEVSALRTELSLASADYAKLLADHEAEKEARTNVQIELDALWLKCTAHNVLLQRVLEADAGCTGDDYARLIEGVKAALEVQS